MRTYKIIALSICFVISTLCWGQTPNNCNEYTSTGTTAAGVNPGTCATPGQVNIGGGTTPAWTGTSCAGFITSTVIGPAISCLTLSYTAVNQDDYGTITTNTGGALTITGVNTNVVGNVVGPFICGGQFVGSVQITVCSTIPFNSVTLTNSGCTSGWVINCATQVACGGGGGGNAGADDFSTVMCNGTVDLDGLVTGTAGGIWTETTIPASGAFNTGTAVFDANAAAAGIYTFSYVVSGGCAGGDTALFQVEVVALATATWTLPGALCTNSAAIDLNTLITGTTGGTWSGTGVTGNMFNPASGSQNVTYSVGTAPCNATSMQMISVTPALNPTWASPGTICEAAGSINLDVLVSGDPGGTWSGTGVSGSTFNPSGLSGPISVTYTIGSAPCIGTDQQNITVISDVNPTWVSPAGLCDNSAPVDLNTTITGTAGGTWSGTGMTGSTFDPSFGTQTITYTVGTAPCVETLALSINATPALDPTWASPGTICEAAGSINLDVLVSGDPGGTWSGTGVTGSTFNPAGLSGPISVTYTIGSAPCIGTDQQNITVNPDVNPTWVAPTTLCTTSPLFDLSTTVTGTAGGTWSGTGVTGNNFDPSVGTQNVTYTVGTGACQQTLALNITIGTGGNPTWTTLTMCQSDAPINLTGQVTGDPGGTWSGTGITGTVFDPFFGTQSITYTVGPVGCTATSTQTITVINPQLTTTVVNVTCFGNVDGTATVNVTGGSGSQTYSWNTAPVQTTQTATNLAAGNYTVTVTDGTCSVTADVIIIEPAEITGVMSAVNGCDPDLGAASIVAAGGVGGFTYVWNNSTLTTATASGLDSNMHTVIVTDANGCTYTDSILVQLFPAPIVVTLLDTTIIYGDCIDLSATGANSYTWTPDADLSCGNCATPNTCPTSLSIYCVEGTDVNGCKSSDCVTIDVEIICGDVFVPSAFSPNDDGENDNLCVYSDCMKSMTFSIYNRWGEKVYETNSMNICWDGTWKGKVLNSAVFVYTLDGYLINGELVEQKGNISLIR